jgi:cytochrome c
MNLKFKLSTYLLPVCVIAFIFICAFSTLPGSKENQLPDVKIIFPANRGKFQWNSILPYKISVKDAEDGSSEYDEIAANEVLLRVSYLPDSSSAKKYLQEQAKQQSDPPGLSLMKVSTCFNCHHAKNKLIGPSFDLIAKRYPNNATTIDLLAQKIITGSTGAWGDIIMPANPDLKSNMSRKMVSWILENNKDSDKYFLTGITGALKTRERPQNGGEGGVYVLTASYEDHGINNRPQSQKRGQHSVILIQ